ncbi:MAG TPA: MIP/aquaporin family protein [Candidatus Limnocylindrales bacterium]|nr:MIP/aquaporin family protein [Candidatus Limnocylindrales bacterium]
MEKYVAEAIGTAILIILGDGVVAGVLLARSKAQNSGWIVITAGWAFAVAVAVYAVGAVSGAHINPAVTIALAAIGSLPFADVPGYIIGQMVGAFLGGVIVYLHYLPHWAETENADLKLAVFSTGPAIRNTTANLISEIIGTFVLVVGVLGIVGAKAGPLTPFLVGILVFGIGLSLGGPTGYAINPARDLGPRIAHAVLPIPGKRDSDWDYAWIPVVGPIIGGVLGALFYSAIFTNFMLKGLAG